MAGIFISYRRADSEGWAGHLFADLCKHFGGPKVFMDYAGITGGAKWDDVLARALAHCDALLVLIGPQWLSCLGSDGVRRIDVPDDWVRREVATALERDIKVVPVLVGDAAMPNETDLPPDLKALTRHQAVEISNADWVSQVGRLVEGLAEYVEPVEADDLATANTGIRLFRDLIDRVPAVADAVGRSKEVIENTQKQVEKLRVFKTMHDALHVIEFECLRPMRAAGAKTRLRPFKIKLGTATRRIEDCLAAQEIHVALRVDTEDQLAMAEEAMHKAVDEPGDDSFAAALSELDLLVSGLPPRLNDGIANAAAELDIGRLLGVMTAVRDELPPASADTGAELEAFFQGTVALGRLRDELKEKTQEHGNLQSLDLKLRSVCVGSTTPENVPVEWDRVKRYRSRLEPPFSPTFDAAEEDLTAIESEIDAAVSEDDRQSALALLEEYFRSVSTVFRDVDTALKDFCERLSEVSQPLATILEVC